MPLSEVPGNLPIQADFFALGNINSEGNFEIFFSLPLCEDIIWKISLIFSFSGLSQMGNLKVFMKTPTAVQTTLQQTSSSKIKVVPTVRLKSEKPDPIITTDR